MRRLMRLITAVALATVTLVVPAAATPATRASVVSFWLAPPNTAVAPKGG